MSSQQAVQDLLELEKDCRKRIAVAQSRRYKRCKPKPDSEPAVDVDTFFAQCQPKQEASLQDFSFVSLTPKTPPSFDMCLDVPFLEPTVDANMSPAEDSAPDFKMAGDEIVTSSPSFRGRVTDYQQLKVLGAGTFGKVFLAEHKDTHGLYAIKTFCKPVGGDKIKRRKLARFFLHYAQREMDTLERVRKLNHPNIVGVQEVIRGKKSSSCFVVMDYHDQDLAAVLRHRLKHKSTDHFSAAQVKSLMRQLLAGVAALHQHGILHRDLKPANLLLNDTAQDLKICDFGQSIFAGPCTSLTASSTSISSVDTPSPPSTTKPLDATSSSPNSSNVGISINEKEVAVCTLPYRSPERLVGSEQSTAANDMWSVGCNFAEMLLGKPFLSAGRGANEEKQLALIVKVIGPPPVQFFDFLDDTTPQTPKLSKIRHRRVALLERLSLENKHNYGSLRTEVLPVLAEASFASGETDESVHVAFDLLQSLLTWDPSKRITAEAALLHPWFS